ncbi:MAG: FHA domain-containing protein, partial [Anaerolineales bacterium]|nr:FHA domain-containing protein [Anaerolineales bacterium]
SVGVRVGESEVISQPQTFSLAIAPPNPIFLSPPEIIERTIPAGAELEPEALTPESQKLEILVEFPDGHERPLASTTLFVNDEPVDVNTAAPFDVFEWDLSEVVDVGAYSLRVEAVDILGLAGTSVNTPIRVEIVQPAEDAMGVLSRNGTLLAAAAIVMAGAVLFLILVMGGRLRPRGAVPTRSVGASPSRKTRPAASRRPTQPAKTRRMMAMTAELPGALTRSKTRARAEPKAYLTWLNGGGDGNGNGGAEAVPIRGQDVIFGTDSRRATLQLEDSSVESVHARLRQKRDGTFELRDEGSVAGTWVNYAPVSRSWTKLEEGDLIHVGKVGFRFHSSSPTRPRRTKVTHGGSN